MGKIPDHIAIIMDGNGRWAKKRKLPRAMGHAAGVKTVDTIVAACAEKGVKTLTLYAFSTENWKRSKDEVGALMGLLEKQFDKLSKLQKEKVRLRVIGRIDEFSESLKSSIKKAIHATKDNPGMLLTLALNYGGRQEILDAVRGICREAKKTGFDAEGMGEDDFEKFLYTAGMADPDLIIRTSGEQRISNFLIWQGAYSEYYVTDALWPDFNKEELEKAIEEYDRRDRRYGR